MRYGENCCCLLLTFGGFKVDDEDDGDGCCCCCCWGISNEELLNAFVSENKKIVYELMIDDYKESYLFFLKKFLPR